LSHLHMQALIGKGIGGKLVAEKTSDNLFGKDDGIERHEMLLCLLSTAIS